VAWNLVGIGEQFEHSWGVANWPPRITQVEANEQIRREKRHLDAMEHRLDRTIATADERERQVCFVALLGEALSGAALGLRI
jgi:hypothetical protein